MTETAASGAIIWNSDTEKWQLYSWQILRGSPLSPIIVLLGTPLSAAVSKFICSNLICFALRILFCFYYSFYVPVRCVLPTFTPPQLCITCQTTRLHISESSSPTHSEQTNKFLNVIPIRYRRGNLVCVLNINVCSNVMNQAWTITPKRYSLWTVIIAWELRILGPEAHFQTILSVRISFKPPAIMYASYVSKTASVILFIFVAVLHSGIYEAIWWPCSRKRILPKCGAFEEFLVTR